MGKKSKKGGMRDLSDKELRNLEEATYGGLRGTAKDMFYRKNPSARFVERTLSANTR